MTSIQPINPNATPEARALLEFLYEISGRAILSGQHNTPAHGAEYNEEAAEITGMPPALWGQDFGFSKDDMDATSHRQAVMDEAKRQYAKGTIVTLMWHAVRPIEDEPVTFKEGICGKLTDSEWSDLITPGTEIHARWEAQVDVIAGFLKQLQAAKVPVLWRPYHEMNGDWFWWGYRTGPRGYAALWRQLYERLAGYHGLDNLVWVWNANAPRGTVLPHADCFPGHEYVDVLATDVYGADFKQIHHDDMLDLAEGKPIALGEVGDVPTPEILDSQPRWCWFMVWSGLLTKINTPEQVRALYGYSRTLNLPSRDNWERMQAE